jgi:uncharacterized protein (UPF0332 family)
VYDAAVNNVTESHLTRAAECLAGARSEFANARYNNAANRAYYAAYNAAIVALIRAGIDRPRWLHDEVQALFAGQLIARRKLYPGELRRVLSDLLKIRTLADYQTRMVSRTTAEDAIRTSEQFVRRVGGVTRW